jgi:hypothetical protein
VKVNAVAYHVVEKNQMILLWLDGERDAPRRGRGLLSPQAPDEVAKWQVPEEPPVQTMGYQFVGLVTHEIGCHIQDIPENGPDGAHLNVVHQKFAVEALSFALEHDWDFTWTPSEEPGKQHTAVVGMKLGLRFFGKFVSWLMVHVHVTQTGPALVHEYLTLPLGLGTVYFCSTVTPISPLLQHYTHAMWCSPWLPRVVAKSMLRGLVAQVNRDVPIWNSKLHRSRPAYSRLDANIKKFRTWYGQFYAPLSESFAEAMGKEKDTLEW